jgi:hypothetical protein
VDAGLVRLTRIAQDGMKVRASAGAASFRRRRRLRELEREVRGRLEKLRRELDDDPAASSRREKAAREKAVQDRLSRVRRALSEVKKRAEEKSKEEEKEAVRASTTDPEARVMKMADGGFRPAYNVQLAADVGSQVVVGVEVTNAGSDLQQLGPMREQVEQRYGGPVREWLVDGGYGALQQIAAAEAAGCRVYAPPMTPRNSDRNPYLPLPEDGEEIARWRRRMGVDSAKQKYKDRGSTIECVNAHARNRGLWQFRVRGLSKVRCVALLHALGQNMMCGVRLREA